ncbi:MAG: DUF4037 domain-containing protein [Spirochaetaceae bacterium]|nr:MAG: DUF4037 domain-containing protein [Spirochaetaceae bacterium]
MDAILSITNEKVLPILADWEAVDSVLMLRFGTDRYDPSFFISYDVYYRGSLPERESRERAFAFAAGFESTLDGQKDRVLLDDVPVRLEYKETSLFDAMLREIGEGDEGDPLVNTYGFYRLERGEVLLERSAWVARTRASLREIPDAFWTRRIDAFSARMDHVLADLSTAVFSGEELFYQLSLASFLSTLCTLLFSINRRFEPAGRLLTEQLKQLPLLPEEFATRLEYLLGHDSAITDKRKREIAELVTYSVLRLV